jgi:(p)ppGpp synthase/HD superfamily hydrolase
MFSNQLSKQLSIYFLIQIEPSSTSYICTSYLHNISENKPPIYQALNYFFGNKIIPLVQKLTQLKERLTFAKIYKL